MFERVKSLFKKEQVDLGEVAKFYEMLGELDVELY